MRARLAAIVAAVWWLAYLVGQHEILELIPALGFTLAWFIVVMRPASAKVDRLISEAREDKK